MSRRIPGLFCSALYTGPSSHRRKPRGSRSGAEEGLHRKARPPIVWLRSRKEHTCVGSNFNATSFAAVASSATERPELPVRGSLPLACCA